jgi:hypothetical protein
LSWRIPCLGLLQKIFQKWQKASRFSLLINW